MTSNSNFPFRSVRLGLAFIFILFMAVASWAEITGEGTESDPYVISSVDDWNTAATESKYFSPSGGSFQYIKLANDLDFTGKTFNIFCGTVGYCSIHFDGQGYAISDISYSNTSGGAAPFAGLDDGGSISHLTVKNSSFYGSKNVAGILIGNYGGTVTDCHVESSVTLKVNNNYCGGIAAINGSNVSTKYSSVITDCSVGAKFELPSHTNSNSVSYGGIVGSQNSTTATISNSLFYGTVKVDNGSSTFFGCISEHNYGTVTGNSYRPAGGFSAFRETADPEGTTVVYAVSGLHEAATGNPAAAYIHNGVRYYAPSTKLTIGTGDENKVFRSFSATGATASLSTDKTKATLTVGTQDITVSATLLTIGGTCGSGTTWRMTDEDKNGTFETLNIGGTGALAEYANGKAPWYSDFRTTITRVNIGNDITTIPANPFYGIGNEAPIVLSTPALALKFKDAAFASKLRVPFGKYLFKATETADKKPAYDIATADDLRHLAAAVNANNSGSGKTFFQTANIDLASVGNFKPIGYADSTTFAGNYDGNRHVISGLKVSGSLNYAGLFGTVSGNIKNVILMNPSVSSSGNGAVVGAIIGKLTGNASNCYFYGGYQINAIGKMSKSAEVSNVSQAYTLTVGEHVSVETSATAPENGFQYDADNDGSLENYYRDGLELTLTHDETVVEPTEMGYALTYLLNGQKSSNISGSTLTVGTATDGKTLSAAIRSDDQTHEITYIDANGTEKTAQAIALDGTESTLKAGWYFVGRDIAYDHALTFSSSANLILGDGKTMNVDVSSKDAINVDNFTIYGQSGQSGILKATATGDFVGIHSSESVTIIGGSVSASGGQYGIISKGNITLSWTNSADNITASSYKLGSDTSYVVIPNGKYFKDKDGNVYSGSLNAKQLSAIAGKTLMPAIPVKYIDEDGKEQTIYNYTVLTKNTKVGSLTGGWFVVEGAVSYSSQVYFSGDVYLILADGAEMTVDVADVADVPAVLVSGNLSIYGQSGQRGIFAATGKSYGIVSIGDVTISGGNVTATSEKSYGINCGNVTIRGGAVTATGENEYGIYANKGDITLSWTNLTDNIKASGYYLGNSEKHVIIANGKALKDEDGNVYSGTINDVSAIADKKLVPCEYMVTFDSQNGSDPVTVTTTFDENGAAHVAKPDDPTRSGYTFAGWFTAKDGDTEFDITSAITANTTLYAKWGVPYIDEDGSEKVRKPGEYTVLTNDVKPNDEGIISLTGGWYVVQGVVNYSNTVKFSEDAYLILADGAELNVKNENDHGAGISADKNLTIYGQSGQRGTLTVEVDGGSCIFSWKNVTINGGNVKVSNGSYGITGYSGVTINDGIVMVLGAMYGIFSWVNVTISGGTLTATGGLYGIYILNYGDITLSLNNSSDYIKASSYHTEKGSVKIADGKLLKDENGNVYGGLLTNRQLSSIKGLELKDFTGVSVSFIDNFSGTPVVFTALPVDENGNVAAPKRPFHSGHKFLGWYEADGITKFNFANITASTVAYAKWEENSLVEYIDENGEPKSTKDYVLLTNDIDVDNLPGGWYVVQDEVRYTSQMTFNDNAYMILANGAKLNVEYDGVDNKDWNEAIWAKKNLTIYGQCVENGESGSLTASSSVENGNGIIAEGDFSMVGGSVTAIAASGFGDGIRSSIGDISLSWTNRTDAVKAISYYLGSSEKHVTIAEGKAFTDENGNVYRGTLTKEQLSAIADKKLVPCEYMVTFDSQNGSDPVIVAATFDENGVAHVAKPDDPTRSGYTFAGWFTAKDGDTEFDITSAITANTTLYAKWSVPYIDEDGNEKVRKPGEYTVLTSTTDVSSLVGGWYVVQGVVSYTNTVQFSEDAHLILADGAEMTVEISSGDAIHADKNLSIYGQSGRSGILAATSEYNNGISIGGDITIAGGNVTISGGNVWSEIEYYGINSHGNVAITGGNVTATSGFSGIYSDVGNISLSWNNSADNIKVDGGFRFNSDAGHVVIPEGKAFTDEDGKVYSGTLTNEQVNAINYKSLSPFTGIFVAFVDKQGDKEVTVAAIPVGENGHVATPYEPMRSGYTFMGWYTTADGDTEFNFANITASTTAYAKWEENALVEYIDENGKTKSTKDYVLLTSNMDVDGLSDGWYVVKGEVSYTSSVCFGYDAHLILADGAKMTVDVSSGDAIYAIGNFTIYGQSGQSGILVATTKDEKCNGIYGNNITISGGNVTAIGNVYGIKGYNNVAITGGSVTASGNGAGICGFVGDITLSLNFGYIKASSYYENGSVKVARDKLLKDDYGNVYSGKLAARQLEAVKDQMLKPFTGTVVSFIDNSSETPVVFATIPVDEIGYVAAPEKHPFHSGKTFLGWYEADGVTEFNFTEAITANTTAYAKWGDNSSSVEYIDEKGETKSVSDYVLLTNDIYVDELPGGWYVVQGKVSYTSRVNFSGDANLILADGAEMNVVSSRYGIYAEKDFTIYSQGGKSNEGGESVPSGMLTASGNNCGIYSHFGSVTISGGNVKASGVIGVFSDVVLGWTSITDAIKASSYNGISTSHVIIAEGKSLQDEDGNVYRGTLTNEQVAAIKGKTLTPAPVNYIDENGNEKSIYNYTVLTSDIATPDENGVITLPAGWYVVENSDPNGVDVALSSTLSFSGDVNLILADDAELNISGVNGANNIVIDGDAIDVAGKLTVYGQSNQTGSIFADAGENGINAKNGTVVNGGSVKAYGTSGKGFKGTLDIHFKHYKNSIVASSFDGSVTVSGLALTESSKKGIYEGDLDENQVTVLNKIAENSLVLEPCYVVKFDKGDGSDPEFLPAAFDKNGVAHVAEPADPTHVDGYSFLGWFNLDNTKFDFDAPVTANTDVFAHWEKDVLTVTFDTQDGRDPVIVKAEYDDNGKAYVAKPVVPTREGYTFLEWVYIPDGSASENPVYKRFDFTAPVTANMTVYAKWWENVPVEYSVAGLVNSIGQYTVLTSWTNVRESLPAGWYVVVNSNTDNDDDNGVDVRFTENLSFGSGVTRIILLDGAEMVVSDGVNSTIYADVLNVYGQTEGTGKLTVNSGNKGIEATNVNIYGGVVDAKGVMAGIYSSRTVSIYGGKVSVPKTSLYGIYVGMGDIALDWNNDGDRYTIGGYTLLNGSVIIAENKYFTDDDGNVYKGKLNDDQVAAIEGKTLKPANAVPYIDENGKEKFVTNYTVLTSDVAQTDENGVITLPAGWYVVQGNVELANRIAFAANDAGSKDVHLILADDAKMKVETKFSYAIGDSTLSTLTIYGQKNQSGVLEVSSEIRTGIYSYKGSIAIVGGYVNVSGENGIEANYVTIAGGNVEAKGDCYGISSVDGITLGWMNSTDAVKASSYDGTVTIATGKAFKDEKGNEYRGTLEADQIADIAGKKLVPLGPKSLTSEDIVITDIPVQNYDKSNPVCPDTVIVTDGDYVLKDDKDYIFECFKNTEVSSATLGSSAPYVKITGMGNYVGEIEKRFYIWENIGKYAAVQVYKDYGGVIHAEIDGDYTGKDAVNIPNDIEVDMVNFNRKFTVTKNGGFSTLMLPFSVKSVYVKGVEGFYKFAYVADCDVKKDGKNDVCVNKVWENTDSVYVTLEANTPYMVKMKESTLRINTKVTLAKTTDGILYDKREKTEDARKDTWQMHGVFSYKKWKCGDDELGKVWGYAGEPRKNVYIGKYVKFGKEVWINPFRAYLYDPNGEKMQCADNSQPKAQAVAASPYARAYTADFLPAPAKSAANATASSEVASLDEFGGMQVVVVEDGRETSIADGKGTTAVGRKNPTATQIRLKPRTTQTYDLKGRRVGNGKKAKGAYYRR